MTTKGMGQFLDFFQSGHYCTEIHTDSFILIHVCTTFYWPIN